MEVFKLTDAALAVHPGVFPVPILRDVSVETQGNFQNPYCLKTGTGFFINSALISVICENLFRRVTQMARRAAQMINYEEITLRSLAVLAVILLWILNSL